MEIGKTPLKIKNQQRKVKEVNNNTLLVLDDNLFSYLMKTMSRFRPREFSLHWRDKFLNSRNFIGPSGVRALPLGVTAERSVHYIWYYFSFFLSSLPHTFLPEGVVLGL